MRNERSLNQALDRLLSEIVSAAEGSQEPDDSLLLEALLADLSQGRTLADAIVGQPKPEPDAQTAPTTTPLPGPVGVGPAASCGAGFPEASDLRAGGSLLAPQVRYAVQRYCPHLGLRTDRASVFSLPTEEHRCYAGERPQRMDLGHQEACCLVPAFDACPRYAQASGPGVEAAGLAPSSIPMQEVPRPAPWLRGLINGVSALQWVIWLTMAGLVLATVYLYVGMALPPGDQALSPSEALPLAAFTPTPGPPPTESPPAREAAWVAAVPPSPPPPTATLAPGQLMATFYPAGDAVGWLSSADPLNHFGERNLHAGVFDGVLYHGAIQFSLAPVPAGSRIEGATVELVGLSAENLGTGGSWSLHLLSPEIDKDWAFTTYEQIHSAASAGTISPELTARDLGAGRLNVFTFTPVQLPELERRLRSGLVSFRLDGPGRGADNLFTWYTGYAGGFGSRPLLRVIYRPPSTPTPLVVTPAAPTSTPANIVTAAARAATATYQAATTGTPTPLPANLVTATPPYVITHTPVPGNTATAQWLAAVATAEAFLNGTPTLLPAGVWTATPTRPYLAVTATPSPENVLTAAAHAARATHAALTIGTYTPVPDNWVVPVVVTARPAPANPATALYQAAQATAETILFGTPTPTPPYVWTATPTPLLIPLQGQVPTPGPTPTPTATPRSVPPELVGRIVFLSDRAGGEQPLVYVVDPDGANLALLSDRWPYDLALQRDAFSADQRFHVFVKDAVHWEDGERIALPALYLFDRFYSAEEQITHFGGGIAYDPAWSPAREQIAFVSNDSGNDEIWVINRDGTGACQLTRDDYHWWDKHPSWSPDGSQIVFWSNRSGNRQIWVMNADGSGLVSLSRTGFNDWDPVWIKYTDPPRGLAGPDG